MKKSEKKKNEILAPKTATKPTPTPQNRTAVTIQSDSKLPHLFELRKHPKIPQILTAKTIKILETDVVKLKEQLSRIYPISIIFIIACTLVTSLISVGSALAVLIFYDGAAKIPYTVLAFLFFWIFYSCCFCFYVSSIWEAQDKRQKEADAVTDAWERLEQAKDREMRFRLEKGLYRLLISYSNTPRSNSQPSQQQELLKNRKYTKPDIVINNGIERGFTEYSIEEEPHLIETNVNRSIQAHVNPLIYPPPKNKFL